MLPDQSSPHAPGANESFALSDIAATVAVCTRNASTCTIAAMEQIHIAQNQAS